MSIQKAWEPCGENVPHGHQLQHPPEKPWKLNHVPASQPVSPIDGKWLKSGNGLD